MLTRDSSSKELFGSIATLVSSIGLKTVEVTSVEQKGSVQMRVILYREEGEINTEDLEKAYNIIYPRYEVLLGDRDLMLEVSSPGIQRNFKDVLEFAVFKGKVVRVYSVQYSSYVTGRILEASADSVTLVDYVIEDKKEGGESIVLAFDDIAKAKLECRWEEKND